MRMHDIKCWPMHYDRLIDGSKRFEVRKNDRDYQVGDKLWIREWDPKAREYTERDIVFLISYIMSPHSCMAAMQSDFVILSLNEVSDE